MEFGQAPIDRTGFDDIHIHDWPLVVYNGVRQTIDMRPDDPRRQDYCAWCRGFGSQRVFLPDLCPGCRGTCLVTVRQQYFLMDRMYHRLDEIIYPDWPIWIERKNPILGSKSGQWNNVDPVMSARARIVEVLFDEERRKLNPTIVSRIQYPSPEVEKVLKEMKFSRSHFPPKPDVPVRISCKFFPPIAPDFKLTKIYIRSSDEIKKFKLQPYGVTPKSYDFYNLYARHQMKSDSPDKRSEEDYFGPETDAKNLHPSENGTKNFPLSENCTKNFPAFGNNPKNSISSESNPKNFLSSENDRKSPFSSSARTSNADPSEHVPNVDLSGNDTKNYFLTEMEPKHLQYELLDRFKTLKHQENQLRTTLKVLRHDRHALSAKLVDANLPRKEMVKTEETLMKLQEKIVSFERDLDSVMSTLSNTALPASQKIPEVEQFSRETIVTPTEMSAREIRFTQTRSLVVRRSSDECDWDVSGRSVKLAGERYLDGKIDGLLTAEDIVVGMTLATDAAMFNSCKVRSDSRIKFVRNEKN